jgi:rare lipoprotein A
MLKCCVSSVFGARRLFCRFVPLFAGAAILVAGCAQAPTAKRSKEFFPESIYGPASKRVVSSGQAVPRGGGRFLVGRPYTIAGKKYVPQEMSRGQGQVGGASWYGDAFHGRRTANGEIYDMMALSAAHPTMPLPSYARVTNLKNNRSIMVRVNDRGPFHSGRVLDVSKRVADALDFRRAGTAQIRVEYVSKAGLAGSDDAQLAGSFRVDGRPARLDGSPSSSPVMMAETAPQRPQGVVASPASAPVASVAAPLPPALQPMVFAGVDPARSSLPSFAPMPLARPFDLATIPGADVPIMAAPRSQRMASFYTAPEISPSPVSAMLVKRRPFDAVDIRDALPWR